MRKAVSFCLSALLAGGFLAGCPSETVRVKSVEPSGGEARIFNKPYDTVFQAAVRVMHNKGQIIRQAEPEKGRIVALGRAKARAIFLTQLSHGRTRVELSTSLSEGPFTLFPGGPEGFFAALREQIVVFEKKKVFKREQRETLRKKREGAAPAGSSPARPTNYRPSDRRSGKARRVINGERSGPRSSPLTFPAGARRPPRRIPP